MTKYIFTCVFLLTAVVALNSCNKRNQCSWPAATVSNIQGNWTHSYPTDLEPDFTQPDKYDHIRFTADSFYLQKTYFTDIAIPGCNMTEYVKGKFAIGNAQLSLNGVYTEADYSVKTSTTCNRTGPFIRTYDIGFCDEALNLYLLNSTMPDRFRSITLVKE